MHLLLPLRIASSAVDLSVGGVKEGGRIELTSTRFTGETFPVEKVLPVKKKSNLRISFISQAKL